jgi:Putative zinc-finger
MRCEEVRELLPDHALGTLDEVQEAALRRHLRGCGACRSDALSLDTGVAMFASAAHDLQPPPELRERVMTVLQEEWTEAPSVHVGRHAVRRFVPWLATAAAVVALAGVLAWALVAQSNLGDSRKTAAEFSRVAKNNQSAAQSYHEFLSALGGREVRVAKLRPTGSTQVDGNAILYDSDEHQSWGLILVTAPGYVGDIDVTLVSTTGRTIKLPFPVQIDGDGQGSDWIVTSADIGTFKTVRLTAKDGTLLAVGTTSTG